MFNLTLQNQEITMSSYDFLNEVINPARMNAGERPVENRKFVARVEDELDDLGAGKTFPRFGNSVKYYDLNMEQMTLVGMRESKAVRRSVLETLKRFARQSSPQLPQTFSEALQLAANQAAQLEAQAPKVRHYDLVVEKDHLLNATQVAGKLNMSAVRLNRFLDDLGVYNKAVQRGRVFKQGFIDRGYGEMKQTETGHAQAMFTTKGEAWIIKKLTTERITA